MAQNIAGFSRNDLEALPNIKDQKKGAGRDGLCPRCAPASDLGVSKTTLEFTNDT
jgi:hypothetical protein